MAEKNYEIRVKLPKEDYQFVFRYRIKKLCSTKEVITDAIKLLKEKYASDESDI